jgi:carbamoyl-phosphate synthase large subunit
MMHPIDAIAGAGPMATPAFADAARELREAALACGAPFYTTMADRRAHAHQRSVVAEPVKLFIRQPFTESDVEQQRMISEILRLIDGVNGTPYPFDYLTGIEAESAQTFKQSFERDQRMPFTPKNFRDHRLALLDRADAMINIRVGMSESSAFELSYHIFKGRRTPVLFLVWNQAPIKTTLIRELDDLVDVTYIEFDRVEELREGIRHFFNSRRLGNTQHTGQHSTAPSTGVKHV